MRPLRARSLASPAPTGRRHAQIHCGSWLASDEACSQCTLSPPPITLLATGRQAIHPTPRPGTKRPRPTTTALTRPTQRLQRRPCSTAAHVRRATTFRRTDRPVITQKQIAITPGNPTLAPGARLVGRQRRGRRQHQYQGQPYPPGKTTRHSIPSLEYGLMLSALP